MSLCEVLNKVLDSKDFTVGGGSASAISGAMAAGLVGMVARLSVGKDYGLQDERYQEIIEDMDTLAVELATGAEEDTLAYLGIKNAFSMPKSTETEKSERRRAIEDAAEKAAMVPLGNARNSERVLDICREMDGKSNPNAGSDMSGAFLLARSAVLGCALNIDANLSLIKDEEKHRFLKEASEKLKKSAT